jgi:hypothetical protein
LHVGLSEKQGDHNARLKPDLLQLSPFAMVVACHILCCEWFQACLHAADKVESQTVALDVQNTLFEDKCDEVGRLKDLFKDSLKIGVKEALHISSLHMHPPTRKLDSDTVRYRAVECFSYPCFYFLEFGCMP